MCSIYYYTNTLRLTWLNNHKKQGKNDRSELQIVDLLFQKQRLDYENELF